MTALEVQSGCGVNAMIWISSLLDDDMGPSNRMIEDVETIIERKGLVWGHQPVKSVAEFYQFLGLLEDTCSTKNLFPIIHFDMHGTEQGLRIAHTGEIALWSDIIPRLRAINVATKNNLCIVAGVCYGFYAITEVDLLKPCPAYLLIAPQTEVTQGFLESNIINFYGELFSTGNINEAHRKHLAEHFNIFHSERFLIISVTRYIKNSCRGKALRERRETLLSQIMLNGSSPTPKNLTKVRKNLRAGLKPTQEMINKWTATFLVNNPCPITMDRLLEFVANLK